MKAWLSTAVQGFRVTIFALICIAVGLLCVQAVCHIKILRVQTGSMRPTFAPGDALLMGRITTNGLKPGMIVTYHSSRNPAELITHRVVHVLSNAQGFQMQGDALSAPDPPVRSTALVGKVIVVAPGLGKILGWLQTWPGLICVVYIPVVSVTISELQRMERTLKKYRLYQHVMRQVV